MKKIFSIIFAITNLIAMQRQDPRMTISFILNPEKSSLMCTPMALTEEIAQTPPTKCAHITSQHSSQRCESTAHWYSLMRKTLPSFFTTHPIKEKLLKCTYTGCDYTTQTYNHLTTHIFKCHPKATPK